MVRFAALAVVLTGCDAVFGLSDITDPALIVNGSYRLRYVSNDATFAPVVSEKIYPPGSIQLSVTLFDGVRPTVTYNADGTFSFPVEYVGQPYRLAVTVDVASSTIEQSASRVNLVTALAGRPDRLPLQQTTVQFAYPSPTEVTQGAYVMSTGIYTQTYTGQFGPTVKFDWRLSTPLAGATLGLLEAAKHDQIFAAQMDTDTSIPNLPYTTLAAVSSASITQVAGGTAMINQPQPVTRNTCMRLSAANLAQHARLIAAAPRAYTGSVGDWYAFMTPVPETMANTGQAWVAAASYSPIADIDIAPTFYDPFVGMTLVAESAAVGYFDFQLPGAAPLQYGNVIRRYALAERGTPGACTPAKTMLAGTVAIPTGMTLEDTPLDTDGQSVALDLSRDLVVSWTTTADPVDTYGVGVQELVNINGVTTPIARGSVVVAGQTTAIIDHNLFAPGGNYVIAISTLLGRPNAAAGEWGDVQLPLESATVWSHYFTVQAL